MQNINQINTSQDLQKLTNHLSTQKTITINATTTGPDPHIHSLQTLQIGTEDATYTIHISSCFPDGVEHLKQILQSPSIKIFHDAKPILPFLIPLKIHPTPIFDLTIASQILHQSGGPPETSLSFLTEHYLGQQLNDPHTPNPQTLLNLRTQIIERLKKHQLIKLASIEFRCAAAVAQMQYHGITLDTDAWHVLTKETEHQLQESLHELYKYSGYPPIQKKLFQEDEVLGENFDSNRYIIKLLSQNGIKVRATSKRDLYPYRDHPLVQALAKYRRAGKSLSAFLYSLPQFIHPKTKRLHPQYQQINDWGGRMCSYDPNIQQIPRDPAFRRCFIAPPDKTLIIADYSQIELRVAAQITRDKRMMQAYRQGQDLHRLTASLILNKPLKEITKSERQAAKAVNFGLIYGMGATGLQQYAGISYGVNLTRAQAENFRTRFFQAYTGIKNWHHDIKTNPPKEIRTLAGRNFISQNSEALPLYSNVPVQGTAADIMKLAMANLAEKLHGTSTHMIANIHDEVILETPTHQAQETASLLKHTMESAAFSIMSLVPVKVDITIAPNWAEK